MCTVYCVLCTVYCVLCIVYCVLCPVYWVLCNLQIGLLNCFKAKTITVRWFSIIVGGVRSFLQSCMSNIMGTCVFPGKQNACSIDNNI